MHVYVTTNHNSSFWVKVTSDEDFYQHVLNIIDADYPGEIIRHLIFKWVR